MFSVRSHWPGIQGLGGVGGVGGGLPASWPQRDEYQRPAVELSSEKMHRLLFNVPVY